jgi:hypothetical protein
MFRFAQHDKVPEQALHRHSFLLAAINAPRSRCFVHDDFTKTGAL